MESPVHVITLLHTVNSLIFSTLGQWEVGRSPPQRTHRQGRYHAEESVDGGEKNQDDDATIIDFNMLFNTCSYNQACELKLEPNKIKINACVRSLIAWLHSL